MSKKQQQQRRKRKTQAQKAASRRALSVSDTGSPGALPYGPPEATARLGKTARPTIDQTIPADRGQPVDDSSQSNSATELLDIGLAALRRKRFPQAAQFFQQALNAEPEFANAWSALSLAQLGQNNLNEAQVSVSAAIECGLTSCAHQLGFGIEMFREEDFARAEFCFRFATRIQPEMCEAHNNLANAAHRQGKLHDAIEAYDHALRIQPKFASALYNRGVAYKQLGEFDLAVESLEEAIVNDPNHVDALCNLGQIAQRQQRPKLALQWFEMAASRRPENDDIAYCLGNLCLELSRCEAAIEHYQRVIRSRPNFPDALNNLGACQAKLGRDDEARGSFEQALAAAPNFAPALENLGDLHCREGRHSSAVQCFARLLESDNANVVVLLKKGRALTQVQDFAAAEQAFRTALRLQPDSAQTLAELGMVALRLGSSDDAKSYLDRAITLEPKDPQLRYSRAIALPVIYDDPAQIESERENLVQSLNKMHQAKLRIDPFHDSPDTLFYLAYQGRNDRNIQSTAASLFRKHDLTAGRRCRLDRRLRIGFLTRYLSDHTVGILTGGLMANLDADKFATVTLSLSGGHPWFESNTDEFHCLPNNVGRLANHVASLDLDILVYPEIGMDPLTNLAARTRLAPVQCAMWGHPVTSGIPEIDYFVSSRLLESEDAQSHYSEQLALLDTLPAFYFRPRLDQPLKSRSELGLPIGATLYGCPQSLFKMHPDFDGVIDRILDHDPQSHVVLIEGSRQSWTERLKARLARTMQHSDRVIFMPRQSGQDFYSLLTAVDVALDPLHFGGGRSNYLTMAAGTPLVTMPAPFMRGRVAYGMYRMLGYEECVCDSLDGYVAKAIQLGEREDYRSAVGAEIKSRSSQLFEDQSAVKAFEQFLLRAGAAEF